MTDYEDRVREQLERQRDEETKNAIIKEIRNLDILIGNHREQLFRTQLIIKSFVGKRKALYEELGVNSERWDVT